MRFQVVIPARHASTRLPGKVLADVHGHPLVWWTWQQACRSGAERVLIATESEQVVRVCEAFGADVCLTGAHHRSGTERLAEVITRENWSDDTIVVNVQADEPLLPPELIRQVAEGLAQDPEADMATLCEPFEQVAHVQDPNRVKVVRDHRGHALMFSRAPLPWDRDGEGTAGGWPVEDLPHYRRHVGLYAYRAGFVKTYVQWPVCPLERLEKLEQLRVLYHGGRILVLDALKPAGIGVDTPEDLDMVRALLR